jgi:CDGSH-type Zn-finger protein
MILPKRAKSGPYRVTLEPNKKYAWCSCGLSENQPFCDGAHKGTDFKPVLLEVKESREFLLCGCKKTKNKPYCDGSH